MKTINFKEFKMYNDIAHSSSIIVDVRGELADNIYKATNGIAALDLALKIHRSDGPVELDETEFSILDEFAKTGTPRFIDSFRDNIQDKP